MKFDYTKHDIEQCAIDLKVLGKVIDMSDNQILKNVKGSSLIKVESQWLEMCDTNAVILKARYLELMFKSKLLQTTISLMLINITKLVVMQHTRMRQVDDQSNVHFMNFCKTGIEPERLTIVIMKPNTSIVTAKVNA